MVSFFAKLLRLCRPYRQRLALGILMGLLGGLMEPLLMVCVKVAVDVAFPGATVMSAGSPMFSRESINDLPALTARLQSHKDEVSKYLYSRFSLLSQEKITAYSPTNSAPDLLPETLSAEFNLALLDPALYDERRFADVKLSKAAQQLLAGNPSDVARTKLNRMLLESAYPTELTSMKLSVLDKYPWLQQRLAGLTKWLPTSRGSTTSLSITLAILSIPMMMLLRGLVSYLNVYFLQWVAVRAIADLRSKLFAHLIQMPLGMLTKMSTGELISRVMGDTGALQNAISGSLVVLIKDPATLFFLIVFLLWQQPMLTLLSMVIFPICLVPIITYSRKVRASSTAIQTQSAQLSRIIHESFTGNRIIKAYNLENNVVLRFRDATGNFITHYMRSTRAGEMPGPLIEFFGAVGVACLFYYILILSHKRIGAGDFLFFVGCVFSMYRPIKSLSRLYTQLEQANAASARVFKLLDTPTTLPEPADPLPLKAAGAEIKFDRVSFQYEADHARLVLQEFTLTVKAGQMVALVGHTGSGKTTVTNLLLRFYDPQKGSVRIGGIDIRKVMLSDLRHQIAVVTQDTLLFDESIRRNIELGRPGATEDEIIAAAKHAHAHEFIIEKPQGYATLVGEKGVLISGGQKQRLAIARAILKNAPILILDEATSALDTQVERAVQAALEELMEGRTTICIAHRLSTIQRADVIVVLDQGRIVEMGRHEELLGKNGVYRRLYELQFQV
ncbi:MAG TPA: ABC transporter ATP-binding protein [Verrucomicrobiae bacterium]|nr:ABC transporter ATP-binding protein [Verrucomicrobiae bacterium]